MSKSHNLNINTYSFAEILGLFDLSYDIDLEGIKRAKKKVLMSHPDKSHLPSEYFLFYKRAFELVVQFYEDQARVSKAVPKEQQVYVENTPDKNTHRIINEQTKGRDFHRKFNDLFDSTMSVKPDNTKNDWFHADTPMYQTSGVSVQTMGKALDSIKQQQNTLIRREQIRTLGGGGTSLYDDDDVYVSSDPFSKLKYDDLRKVHKDQTVFAVSEKDYDSVKKYSSVDHLKTDRGSYAPEEKTDTERAFEEQRRDRLIKKQHEATLKSMEYAKKNSDVLGSFLQISR
jgi:hypothetical protein